MSTYQAIVTEDWYVSVLVDGVEINRPGPWDTAQGAHDWAAAVVAAFEAGINPFE